MPTNRLLTGRITVGLLLIVVAAGCSRFGPQLYVDIDERRSEAGDGDRRLVRARAGAMTRPL